MDEENKNNVEQKQHPRNQKPTPGVGLFQKPNKEKMIEPEPFFMLGSPRSGTTLLRNLLRQHPDIFSPEETFFFRWAEALGSPDYDATYANRATIKLHRKMDGVEESTFKELLSSVTNKGELMEKYCRLVEGKTDKPKVWFDKTPQNAYGLALITHYFPKSPIVHIHRHPVEVVASIMEGRSIGRHPINGAINAWMEPTIIINQLRPILGDKLIEISFRSLLDNPMECLCKLAKKLNLAEFSFNTKKVNSALGMHIARKSLSDSDVATIQSRCAELMEKYQYQNVEL